MVIAMVSMISIVVVGVFVVVVMVIVVAIALGNALQEVVKKMNSIQPYPYFKNGQHFLRPRHGGCEFALFMQGFGQYLLLKKIVTMLT
jgi:hypothetical protein